MSDLKKSDYDLDGLINKLNSLASNLDEADFGYGSTNLEQFVHEALSENNFTKGSDLLLDEIIKRCELFDTWTTLSARWKLLMDQVESYLLIDPVRDAPQGEEEINEEEPPEEPSEQEDEEDDEDEEGGSSGLAARITEEYARKREIDQFILKKLPTIPIVGLPFRFVIFAHSLWIRFWHSLLDLLSKIAEYADAENNVMKGVGLIARFWKPFSWAVTILATLFAYSHWIWYGLIWPVLRWLTDPIGRTFKFFKSRLGKGTSGHDEQGDGEESEGPVGQ